MRDRTEAVLNDSPVDYQIRRRPRRAVRVARALYFPPRISAEGLCRLLHQKYGLVAQLVRALACHARGRGFEPHPSRHTSGKKQSINQQKQQKRQANHTKQNPSADLAHLVERDLAKVEVAGSSPVIRSIK